MTVFAIRHLIAAPLFGLLFAAAALAADTQTTPVENAKVDDFAAGKKAMDGKNWTQAVSSFNKVVAQNPKNADAYNYLGYANRWLGKYPEAFAAYDKALAINPKHKGALEYSGVAFLKTNQKENAEAQLAKLKAICTACEETMDLAKAVADYKLAAK